MEIVRIKTTTKSFQMRYCMQIYLKGGPTARCERSRLLNLLNKRELFLATFNFNFWQFWCPLRLNIKLYLIWKVSIVVWNPKLAVGVAVIL